MKDGHIDSLFGKIYYRTYHESKSKIPLLVIQGGPAAPHDYLICLQEVIKDRPVIFYDPHGVGQSEFRDDPKLWDFELYVKEVQLIRNALQLDKVHIFGHSFGAAVAARHAMDAKGIQTLICASPIFSGKWWNRECNAHIQELTPKQQQVLQAKVPLEDYLYLIEDFARRYWCRIDPLPEALKTSWNHIEPRINHALWGHDPIFAGGQVEHLDLVEELVSISCPVLLTAGEYDIISARALSQIAEHFPNVERKVFDNTAHMHPLEAMKEYRLFIEAWLERQDHINTKKIAM